MKIIGISIWAVSIHVLLWATTSAAHVNPREVVHTTASSVEKKNPLIKGRMPTVLSADELAREVLDRETYPHFMEFLESTDISKGLHPTDPRNLELIRCSQYFSPTAEMWDRFFTAAVADRLTMLRALSLLGRKVKKVGIPMFGSGELFQRAVKNNHVDLGLALPAKNIAAAVWRPDPHIKDPEFQLHMKIFYTEPYTHQFPEEILPADLRIGFGPLGNYWFDGKEYKQPWVSSDIYYGPTKGAGFRNVSGIGGRKRGVVGFVQKLLFFLPDAVESMIIREESDEMVTEALVNTVIKGFEKNPLYSMKKSKGLR